MSAAKKEPRIRQLGKWGTILVGCLFVAASDGWFLSVSQKSERHLPDVTNSRADSSRDLESEKQTYSHFAGSASCQECHEEEYKLWATSHHGLAQRRPNAPSDNEAFRAPSTGAALNSRNLRASDAAPPKGGTPNVTERTLLSGARTTIVREDGADFDIVTTGLNNTQQVFRAEGVLGVSPLRQFLVAFPGGRLQTLEESYDPRSNEWFNVFGAENRQAGEWGHWTGRGMNWNSMCASCHNTRVQKNYDEKADVFHTAMVEEGVGCEACHGPLGAHNDWQKRFGKSAKKDPTIPKWPAARAVDNCGFCHARRGDLTGDFKPGDDFFNHTELEIPGATEVFYADGQVHEEDYEYAAFLGSRMHGRGIGCGDCHNPHSAKTILPGNWLCMRCHNGSYTNAPAIDPVAHSHHRVFGYAANGLQTNVDLTLYEHEPVVETGGECVNCHMPQTVYMQRHWRHDHGFSTPDPLLTKEAGVPNACNRCHRDKDTDWALRSCDAWYGPKMERASRQRARLIAAARKREPKVWQGLLGMLETNDVAYWRAVGAGLLQPWADEPAVRHGLLLGLQDTNSLVRAECVRALEPLVETPGVTDALQRRLEDPIRAVRVGAAWALRGNLDLATKAGRELLHCLAVNADQPAGQMQLGAFALTRGDAAGAATHYQRAAEWDPNSGVIRHDYAVALSTLHRPKEAIEQLQAACKLEPKNAEFQYKLALGWNELDQPAKAIDCLRQAVRLDPKHARAWYNLGLALSADGRSEEALDALSRAESADGLDPRSPYAQATILARMGRADEARRAAQRALELEPGFEAARELMRELPAAKRGE